MNLEQKEVVLEKEVVEKNKSEKKQKNQHLIGIGIIGYFFLTQIISSILLAIFLIKGGLDFASEEQMMAVALPEVFKAMGITELISLCGIYFIYKKQIFTKLKEVLSNKKEMLIKIAVYYVLFLVITISISIIDSLLFSQYADSVGENQEMIENALQGGATLWMFITIGLSGPIFEEYVFRYGMMKKVLYGVNKYVAATIASIIFSFIHIGFAQAMSMGISEFAHVLLTYLPAALCFSFVYAREDNLFYPIVMHVINNVQAIVVIMIASYFI